MRKKIIELLFKLISFGLLLTCLCVCWFWGIEKYHKILADISESSTYINSYAMLSPRNIMLTTWDWKNGAVQHDSILDLTYLEKKFEDSTHLVVDIQAEPFYKIPIDSDYFNWNMDKKAFERKMQELQNYKFFRGIRVSIYNASDTIQSFLVQDNRIMMIQEAKDMHGEWQPIEYWSHSSCGNSYYMVNLKPKDYFRNVLYQYQGDFETELRVKIYLKQTHLKASKIIYSKPFKGSIHYSQFNLPPEITKGNENSRKISFFE